MEISIRASSVEPSVQAAQGGLGVEFSIQLLASRLALVMLAACNLQLGPWRASQAVLLVPRAGRN